LGLAKSGFRIAIIRFSELKFAHFHLNFCIINEANFVFYFCEFLENCKFLESDKGAFEDSSLKVLLKQSIILDFFEPGGPFLEGPEKVSHPESQQNLKPYDYRAVLFKYS